MSSRIFTIIISMSKKLLWVFSYSITVVIIIIIGLVVYHKNIYHTNEAFPLYNEKNIKPAVEEIIKQNRDKLTTSSLMYVPTGVFVQSIKFSASDVVQLSGYIWQKYRPGQLPRLDQGINLPEATNLSLKKTYTFDNADGTTTVGYYFEGNFLQEIDYADYPFDFTKIRLRIWPENFQKNIVLIPDFTSYSTLKYVPSGLPQLQSNANSNRLNNMGLDPQASLGEYSPIATYFSYNTNVYKTNLGLKNFFGVRSLPELYFNIVLKRNAVSGQIKEFLPLITLLIFIYGIILSLGNKGGLNRKTGFDVSNVIMLVCTMMLVIQFLHYQMRAYIYDNEVTFVEYVYFALYASLVYVVILDLIGMYGNIENRLLHLITRDDFLIPKLIFLPLFFSYVLIIVLFVLK